MRCHFAIAFTIYDVTPKRVLHNLKISSHNIKCCINGPKGMTIPEERDYKWLCTPGDGNCLLYHAVLEQLCENDNHAFWEATSPTRCACAMHFARVLLVVLNTAIA